MPYTDLPIDQILTGDCREILAQLPDKSIDLIFADPPYDRDRTENWPQRLAAALTAGVWLAPEARFIFEQSAGVPEAMPHGWTLLSSRRYGEAQLYILSR